MSVLITGLNERYIKNKERCHDVDKHVLFERPQREGSTTRRVEILLLTAQFKLPGVDPRPLCTFGAERSPGKAGWSPGPTCV